MGLEVSGGGERAGSSRLFLRFFARGISDLEPLSGNRNFQRSHSTPPGADEIVHQGLVVLAFAFGSSLTGSFFSCLFSRSESWSIVFCRSSVRFCNCRTCSANEFCTR